MWQCPKCGREFKNQQTEYKTSKGAIQLPYEKQLPLTLIAEIAK